jgi:hypothetical protein
MCNGSERSLCSGIATGAKPAWRLQRRQDRFLFKSYRFVGLRLNMQNSRTLGRSRPSTRKFSTKRILLFASLAAGCGGGYLKTSTPMTPATQNASVTGQYNLVLTSTNGHGTTNIYTVFTQTGTTITGAASTLVCPSNEATANSIAWNPVVR